jgi:hypothetical protein
MDEELELQKVLARRIFPNLDEAAVDALSRIKDTDYELGGVLFRDAKNFYSYSDPSGNAKTRQFEARVKIPPGQKLAGIYHTHPAQGMHDPEGERFSPNDVAIADAMKLVSYIKAIGSGNIRKYHPGVSKTRQHRDPNSKAGGRGKVSEGELLDIAKIASLMRDPLDIARGTK